MRYTGNMGKQVVQLHNHSEYSILDGRSRISELVGRVVELGQPAVALTDHGNMYGMMEFYREARGRGIKPILGVEFYMAMESLGRKDATLDRHSTHLTVLATSEAGYRNLLRLTSIAHMEGMYYRPRIDFETLARHNEGLLVLSGCMGSKISQAYLADRHDDAEAEIRRMLEVFGRERFCLEVHSHGLDQQKKLNPLLFAAGKRMGIRVVAACDSHYVRREDARSHDVLLAIQTGSRRDDPGRFRIHPYGEYYLKSVEEMEQAFSGQEQAVWETVGVAEQCNVELDFSQVLLPEFDIPAGYTQETKLREEVLAGMERRGGITEERMVRLNYELGIIGKAGFSQYFLIVQDYVNYARGQGIMAVPRGSVAGSLCMYALGICDIDPVRYDIMFERFLHEERKGMPDVDMDFADDRRDDVISYVTGKYGSDRVAHIGTFQTLGARAAVKDVARVLGVDYAETNRLTRAFPSKLDVTIADVCETDDMKKAMKENPEFIEVLEIAGEIEGLVRGFGTHAAGILIASKSLPEVVPIQLPPGKKLLTAVTQYDNNNRTAVIESIGLSKFDFLGLANLTSIRSACALIKHRHGIDLYGQSGEKLYSELPTEYANPLAARTYDMLAAGETTAVFQMESAGMRKALRLVKPTRLEDLPAVVALYRPGPMENIPVFAAAKADGRLVRNYHPDIDRMLAETYGVVTYQDQVLLLARTIAGFTWGEVDVLRKGMGKKLASVINEQKKKFLEGSVARGYEEDLAEELWETVAPFAGYGFNKAHAYAYGYVAYITAFLKANFPVEYLTAVLTLEAGNREKTMEAIVECRRIGIRVLPPDINVSGRACTVVDDLTIRFGFNAVANMGDAHVIKLLLRREEEGGFASAGRCFAGMNVRVATSLIKSGACDEWGDRNELLSKLPDYIKNAAWTQTSMFDMVMGKSVPAMTDRELLEYERESLGVYLTKSPLDGIPFGRYVTATSLSASDEEDQHVTMGGIITKVKSHVQKNGKPMAFMEVEDFYGKVECVIFASVFEKNREAMKVDNCVIMKGIVRMRDEQPSLVVNTIMQIVREDDR